MSKLKLLIESRPFCVFETTPMERLKSNEGLEVIDMRGSGIEDPKFMEAIKTADAVISGNDLQINDELLDNAPNLKAIAKMGAGIDMIDIDAATRHDVLVFHTPGVNNQAVADHTFALILGVARKIVFCDQSLREKRWEHTKIMGTEIWQKTIGLMGLGAIGRCVALRAKGFQMRIVAYDPYWPEDFANENGIEKMEINELLKVSDVISLHLPLMPETRGIINKESFKLMKPNMLLINAARGGVIDEEDLYVALKNKVIAGAGIDVFEQEPPTDSPLLELDNVVLTPHTAAFTHDAMNNMNVGVVDQLYELRKGNCPEFSVNPEVFERIKL